MERILLGGDATLEAATGRAARPLAEPARVAELRVVRHLSLRNEKRQLCSAVGYIHIDDPVAVFGSE